jgi:hypothetical protein
MLESYARIEGLGRSRDTAAQKLYNEPSVHRDCKLLVSSPWCVCKLLGEKRR